MKNLINKWVKKSVKILTFAICGVLLLSLLIGGAAFYNIPYQGIDMPINVHPSEKVDWSQLIKEESRFSKVKDNLFMNNQNRIFKATLGHLGEAGQIGRGPPKNGISGFLIIRDLRELKLSTIKDLIVKT